MAKAAETTGAVADLIRLVSAAATAECYSIAGKVLELKAGAVIAETADETTATAETGETTAMAKAGGGLLLPWILMVGGAAARRCQAVVGGEEGPS